MIHLRLLGGVELSRREAGLERRINVAPKPLALLAYLAVASARATPVRRDVLLALFWPELSTARARAALRQLLFQLRHALGPNAFRADRETVVLSAEALSCDVQVFEQRLACGDSTGAMEVYRGVLLEGFFVDGVSAALEEWIDSERERLNWKAFFASRSLADEADRCGNGIAAAHWARTTVALAPDNEIAVRRLIEILHTFGDRAGALRVADDFTRRLLAEFGTEPSAETQALIATVRSPEQRSIISSVADGSRMPDTSLPSVSAPAVANSSVGVPQATRTQREPRRIPSPIGRASRRRLLPVVAMSIVAASLLIARFARGARTPAERANAVFPPITIASSAARQLYTEGLKRFYAGDVHESVRLFGLALGDDSTCAMCAYYAALAYSGVDDNGAARMLQLAMHLSDRVSEPERLLIRYKWADAANTATRTAAAESLVTRFPNWPEAQIAAAEAADMDARWLAAAAHLRRAIAAAPPSDSASGTRCPVCAAEHQLYDTYEAADSLPAALRVAQAWVRAQPRSRIAWLELSHALAESGRYEEARAAIDTSTRYALESDDDAIEHAQIEIRAGNFPVADRLLNTLAETGNANSRQNALWFLVISLRTQGRLREALNVAHGAMRLADASATRGRSDAPAEGQILFELGDYKGSAAVFTSLAMASDSSAWPPAGQAARQHAWFLTQAGSAMAAARDTSALARLVDTVQAWGKKSGFERDHRLHEYLRGLLWVARSQPESAVVAFRRAMTSESEGFSRINLELGRALLALGRPREAIPVLEHALAGTLEAGNVYASRTELQESLAHAFDAAGERDSATVYYRAVTNAWRSADSQFRARVAEARARLATDERRIAAQH